MRSLRVGLGLALLLVAAGSLIGGVAQDTPRHGGELVIAEYWEPDNLDPHVSYSRHTWIVAYQLFDMLLMADENKNLHPYLAKSWEVSEDGLHYTFYLRDDVVFHDGTPFNAEAVKYNFERIVDPETGSIMIADLLGKEFESVEVIDEYTVRINFSAPRGPFLLMCGTLLWMVSPTAAEKWGPQDFGFHPVGSGPFRFVEWVPQDHITLERNPDYNWAPEGIFEHQGPPYLERLVFKYIPEAATRAAALETGEVDIAIRPLEHMVERFRADPRFDVITAMVPGLPTTFIFNTNKPPLDDVRVRRALNLWIDREQLVKTVWAGQYPPAYGPLAPNTFAYWPGCEGLNALNRDEALRLMAEAGWTDSDGDGILDKDGEPLKLYIYSCGDYVEPPQGVAAQLKTMGIDAEIVLVPWTEQQRVCYQGKPHMMVATFNNVDPRVLRLLFHSENVGEFGWTWTHLAESDPELQAKLDALLEAGDQEVDLTKRAAIYQEVQKLIVENALCLPLRVDNYIYIYRKEVKGWKFEPGGWLLTYDMWLAEE